MQKSLERPQGGFQGQQPDIRSTRTTGTTSTPGDEEPVTGEILREQQREAQKAEDTRRRAENMGREARQKFREQLRSQQEELQKEAKRLRNKQHKRPDPSCGTPKAGNLQPSPKIFEEKEEEEASEEQVCRSKAWKEAYDRLNGKAEAVRDMKWEEIIQKRAAEISRRQSGFKAWIQQCKDILKHPSSVTKLPEAPYTPCHQPGCSAPKGCTHSVARAFTDARLNQSELESEHRFWHPDRAHFRQVPEPYKDGVLKMADEVFKALQPVVNAGRG